MTITIIGALVVLAFIGKLWWDLKAFRKDLDELANVTMNLSKVTNEAFDAHFDLINTNHSVVLDKLTTKMAEGKPRRPVGRPKKAVKRVKNND